MSSSPCGELEVYQVPPFCSVGWQCDVCGAKTLNTPTSCSSSPQVKTRVSCIPFTIPLLTPCCVSNTRWKGLELANSKTKPLFRELPRCAVLRMRILCIYMKYKLQHTFTPKHSAYCVFIEVCLEHLSYLKSVSHVINTSRLLGLYGENIGPPGISS